MEKNLFVCHSQAQLILAVGLVKGRFSKSENHLILFKDFSIQKEIVNSLETIFDKILFREGTYPALNKSWKAKLKRYPKDIKSIKQFLTSAYQKVFVVCDEALPEMVILKHTYKQNKEIDFIWLEDGSHPYFVNGITNTGLNTNRLTRWLREIFFKFILNLGKFYSFDGKYMGANTNIVFAYLTFVGAERDVYKSKIKVSISDKEYELGLKGLYPANNLILANNSVILVLDKLDVYKDIERIKEIILTLKNYLDKNKITLYYKLHPREEDTLKELKGIEVLDQNKGVESYYVSNTNAGLTVIGVKSTGLQASKKLGFKSISLAKLADETDVNLVVFYEKIGVLVPESYQGLFAHLK